MMVLLLETASDVCHWADAHWSRFVTWVDDKLEASYERSQ